MLTMNLPMPKLISSCSNQIAHAKKEFAHAKMICAHAQYDTGSPSGVLRKNLPML